MVEKRLTDRQWGTQWKPATPNHQYRSKLAPAPAEQFDGKGQSSFAEEDQIDELSFAER